MEKRPVDVVVISDVHLGSFACKAKELVAYLKSISPTILILNGDIIDGWQFTKRYFPPAHIAVIKEILNLMATGTRVFYITGNHDELLRKYSDFQISNFTLTDKLVLDIDQKMTWIFHGDVFDNASNGSAKFVARLGSTGYEMLIVFNKLVNFLLKLAGKEKVSISGMVMAGVNKAICKVHQFEALTADLAIDKKYDYVICGHVHQPLKKVIENNIGKVTYMNSGDWVEHLTSLEYSRKEWTIFQFDEKLFPNYSNTEKQHPVNVMTDEINIYINSLAI